MWVLLPAAAAQWLPLSCACAACVRAAQARVTRGAYGGTARQETLHFTKLAAERVSTLVSGWVVKAAAL